MTDDIIRLIIVGKLRFYPHYRKLAATCSDWQRITKVHGPFQENSVSLVLPHNNETDACALYQISDSETYEFQFAKLHDKFVYGCSRGWLVVCDNNFVLSLINIMTRRRVDLPDISDLIYFLKI
jgi:hypothetical protein